MLNSFFAIIPGMTGWPEIALILVIVLILFGPKRLPEIADAMGKSIRKFKSATKSATDEVKREIDDVGRDINSNSASDSDEADDTKQT